MSSGGDGVGGTLPLLRSAFGVSSTPYTVLRCDVASSTAELRRAYRVAALRYHPDRILLRRRHRRRRRGDGSAAEGDDDDDDDDGDGSEEEEEGGEEEKCTTLKFQAVSAAYRVLMDDRRKSHFDRTGEVLEDDEDDDRRGDGDGNGEEGGRSSSDDRQRRRRRRHSYGRDWENFFRSVFDEMVGAGAKHAQSASAYRGSENERNDVLRYYHGTCKGDMAKVVQCVPYAKDEDVERWMRDIVDPSVVGGAARSRRGKEKEGGGKRRMATAEDRFAPAAAKRRRRTVLEDSSSSEDGEDIADATEFDDRMTGKVVVEKTRNDSLLIDTDDDDDSNNDANDFAAPRKRSSAGGDGNGVSIMSKRDKMDYRVARRRKAMAEKEMDFADVLRSKDWSGGARGTSGVAAAAAASVAIAAHRSLRRTMNKVGGLSDELLSNMEEKYGGGKRTKKTMPRVR
jgi:hypothetical protein